MKRTVFLCWLLALSFCAPGHGADRSAQRVDHIVLVWFKQGTSVEHIQQVREKTLDLKRIPGMEDLHVGLALQSERPIVDDSFDLGISMRFNSVEAMHRYLTHPEHRAFVELNIEGKVDKLLVYDIVHQP